MITLDNTIPCAILKTRRRASIPSISSAEGCGVKMRTLCSVEESFLSPQGLLVRAKTEACHGGTSRYKPRDLQIAAIAIVDDFLELILEPPLTATEIRERQPDVTLALVGCIVHRHQQPLAVRALPGEGQEAIRRSSCLPRPARTRAIATGRRARPAGAARPSSRS